MGEICRHDYYKDKLVDIVMFQAVAYDILSTNAVTMSKKSAISVGGAMNCDKHGVFLTFISNSIII